MKEKHSTKFLRQRKMMLVLPVLIIPFITMGFWALGGGQGNSESNFAEKSKGLNLHLPEAILKDDKNANKLSFYNEADADSIKREELLRNDPYYNGAIMSRLNSTVPDTGGLISASSIYDNQYPTSYNNTTEENEHRIFQKINEINKQINQPEYRTPTQDNFNRPIPNDYESGQFSSEIDRLQYMMQAMNTGPETDPEMQQLNATLEKILDIQHPERIRQTLKEKSLKNREQVFIVTTHPVKNNISLLDTSKDEQKDENRFFSTDVDTDYQDQNTIEAVIHEAQTLVNGAVVRMRLLNDIYINGFSISKGNFIYGIARLNDERLEINIKSIQYDNSLFPVNLEVYDLDGIRGLYIPGSIPRKVTKESTDDALQLLDITAMGPSIQAQAAATGINAGKSLFSKKVKQVKVLVKAGYKVLLRDKNIQQ